METLIKIDSGKPWPTVGIVACTHGNEPIGIEMHRYVQDCMQIKVWSVHLILANPEAHKKNTRFLNYDLNRIWTEDCDWKKSYEHGRKEELTPILWACNIIIDIHSVPIGQNVFGITTLQAATSSMQKWAEVECILTRDARKAGSLTGYCTRQWKESIWLEIWNHSVTKANIKIWQKNIANMLIHYGLVEWELLKREKPIVLYEKLEPIYRESEDFSFNITKNNETCFHTVHPGEIIAENWKIPLFNTYNYPVILFMLSKHEGEKPVAGFLYKKID